jgi:hypothetical protein
MYPIVAELLNLPPSIRFKEQNIVLVGLWVGKHQPPDSYWSEFLKLVDIAFQGGI